MADYSTLRRGLAHYWPMDNGSYPYWQWDRLRTEHLTTWPVVPAGGLRVAGKLGFGCNLIRSPFGAWSHTNGLFPSAPPTEVTFSMWFRMDDPTASPQLLNAPLASPPSGSYSLQYLTAGAFRFTYISPHALPLPGTPTTVDASYAATEGEWIHALIFVDLAGEQIGLRINNGRVFWSHSVNVTSWAIVNDVRFGPAFDGVMDDVGVWSRILKEHEQDWLWNDGNGLAFDNFADAVEEETCQVIPCCEDDPYTYQASAATDSGSATGSDCATLPVVAISPPESSYISFPTYIFLAESVGGAVIRYTTDGTDPTLDSAIYSIPFQIFGPSATVKARAWLGDCAGPIAAATYQRVGFDLTFRNICAPVPSRAGIWGDFTGGTTLNYEWEIDATFAAPTHITAFELYETNSAGVWNTGQAWSTQEYIDPPDSAPNFHVYPLVLYDPAQLNVAYSDDFSTDFGDFAAGAHTISAFGSIQFDVPGVTYFRLRVFVQGGQVIERIIASDTCDPPPCEEQAPDPTVVASCANITVSFMTTAGNPYQIVRIPSGSWPAVIVDSGTTAAIGNTFVDTSAAAGVRYCYALWVKYGICPEYSLSNWVCATKPPMPELTVTQDETGFCAASGTVQFSITSANLAVAGACITDDVLYSYTDGTGLHTGSVDGNVTVLLVLAMTRPAATGVDALGRPIYVVTVTFTGCNECGTVTQDLTVTFQPDAQCTAANMPNRPMVVDIDSLIPAVQAVTLNCTDPLLSCYALAVLGLTTWHGEIPYRASCQYVEDSGGYSLCSYECDLGPRSLGPVYAFAGFFTDRWLLTIHLTSGDYDIELWSGQKLCGYEPVGVYTRTAGCVVALAELEVT